jgi:hypothetical protein
VRAEPRAPMARTKITPLRLVGTRRR